MKRRLRLVIGVVVAMVLVAVILWRALAPPTVTVVAARRADLVDTLAATGVVEAMQAAVAPKIVGRIETLLADEGATVTRGQLLARLDANEQRAMLREREAALRMAEAEVAGAHAALAQERAASRARIQRAQAAELAARARLQDLRAGSRTQEIESARQAVAAAEAEAKLAAADYERMRDLFAKGAVSRANLDAAQARLAGAQAALRAARQELALLQEGARPEQIAAAEAELSAAQATEREARAAAGQVTVLERSLTAAEARVEQARAAVAVASSPLAETDVLAPISGRVGRRYLDVGDLASPQTPLFLITDTDNLWIAAEVDEEDLSLVHVGQKVEVAAEALARPLPGAVVEVAPLAIPRGLEQVRAKIVRSKVVLDEPTELLRPGMEVDVSADTTLARDVLLAPTDALIEEAETTYVMVVRSSVVRRQKVAVGYTTFRDAEITSGLREGDQVVVAGGEGLRDGQRVTAREE
ncbi:MAG: efflux RND transporter periplasmic adaptor subunit [Armatimonadota bacterium]|nr:MAG: efflux RND transporter periplasmic adaptor subunit [Armatimonadota bacterium]